jgi:hypothetical protein
MGLALLVSLAFLMSLGITGCTSDEPNVVGTALIADQIDTVLVPLGVEEISRYSALRVENPDILVHEQEVLYIGEQNGTRSGSLIANFDFDIPFSPSFPESLFTEENIQSVKFSLTKVDFYSAQVEGAKAQPVDLYYQVQKMEVPFLLADYENYPVQPPPVGVGPFLNSDFNTPNNSSEPRLPFYGSTDLLGWITNKEKVGIIVTLGAASDPGLIGYASRELTHFRELDDVAVGTIVAPNFEVTFLEYVGDNQVFLLGPYADSTSFEQVPAPPTDAESGFLLRTGLRSYPTLLFDLSGLPPHAFINRALLSVTNDTTVSFGTLSSISVLEWDEARFGDPPETVELSELNDSSQRYSFHITGQNSLDPTLHTIIQFDVTQAMLRVINNVYSGTRGFILTGGEDVLPEGGFISVSPDFYYREFRFMGTDAEDPLHRPQLKITYSVVNDLDEGGK